MLLCCGGLFTTKLCCTVDSSDAAPNSASMFALSAFHAATLYVLTKKKGCLAPICCAYMKHNEGHEQLVRLGRAGLCACHALPARLPQQPI